MKRWEGESFEAYRARRAEAAAVEKAHLRGRVNGRYVDYALHSLLARDAKKRLLKKKALVYGMLILSAGAGYGIGVFLRYFI